VAGLLKKAMPGKISAEKRMVCNTDAQAGFYRLFYGVFDGRNLLSD